MSLSQALPGESKSSLQLGCQGRDRATSATSGGTLVGFPMVC